MHTRRRGGGISVSGPSARGPQNGSGGGGGEALLSAGKERPLAQETAYELFAEVSLHSVYEILLETYA